MPSVLFDQVLGPEWDVSRGCVSKLVLFFEHVDTMDGCSVEMSMFRNLVGVVSHEERSPGIWSTEFLLTALSPRHCL